MSESEEVAEIQMMIGAYIDVSGVVLRVERVERHGQRLTLVAVLPEDYLVKDAVCHFVPASTVRWM